MMDFTTTRSSSSLIACSAVSARWNDVIVIACLLGPASSPWPASAVNGGPCARCRIMTGAAMLRGDLAALLASLVIAVTPLLAEDAPAALHADSTRDARGPAPHAATAMRRRD